MPGAEEPSIPDPWLLPLVDVMVLVTDPISFSYSSDTQKVVQKQEKKKTTSHAVW